MGCVPPACWPYPSMHWVGVYPSMHWAGGCVCPGGCVADTPRGQTDTCENITCKKIYDNNFIKGGKAWPMCYGVLLGVETQIFPQCKFNWRDGLIKIKNNHVHSTCCSSDRDVSSISLVASSRQNSSIQPTCMPSLYNRHPMWGLRTAVSRILNRRHFRPSLCFQELD